MPKRTPRAPTWTFTDDDCAANPKFDTVCRWVFEHLRQRHPTAYVGISETAARREFDSELARILELDVHDIEPKEMRTQKQVRTELLRRVLNDMIERAGK